MWHQYFFSAHFSKSFLFSQECTLPLVEEWHPCQLVITAAFFSVTNTNYSYVKSRGKKTTAATRRCRCLLHGLFAFALLSFKLQFSAANNPSNHMCEGMEGWRREGAASDDSAPLCASKMSLIISIYPPQTSANLAEPSSPRTPNSARIIPTPPSPISAVNRRV